MVSGFDNFDKGDIGVRSLKFWHWSQAFSLYAALSLVQISQASILAKPELEQLQGLTPKLSKLSKPDPINLKNNLTGSTWIR